MVSIFILIFIRFKLFYDKSPFLSTVRSICNVSVLKYPVESILTTKKYFFRSFFQKQPGFPLKASQNNQLPLFTLKAGYRTIPLTAERPKLFPHTGQNLRYKVQSTVQVQVQVHVYTSVTYDQFRLLFTISHSQLSYKYNLVAPVRKRLLQPGHGQTYLKFVARGRVSASKHPPHRQ